MESKTVSRKVSYSKNYIKIYLWRSVSLITGFLSLLIVVPHLSDNQELYGIYTFCISFTLYLTYADIGFLGAGQKYAAEEFARGNRKEEIGILGFTGAILLLMILPFSLTMIYFYYNPGSILSGLSTNGQQVAGKIFLILGILTPVQIILQRLVQSILIIRIKDYISLRVNVLTNLIKIFSIYFFFAGGRAMLVEYYFFITLTDLVGALIILIIIKRTEKYDFLRLFRAIKLSKKYFLITKKLAFSSLLLTIAWLIYYELDIILIGKWFSPKEVAIYAIGFTFLNFLRTLWNTVFSPFSQRFNHFVGTGSTLELKKLITKIIDYTLPLNIITTIVLVVAANKIVLFWVGREYVDSIIIMQILVLGTGFAYILQPASFYFMAKTKYNYIYLLALILPVVFILGIIGLVPKVGIVGFAISKSFVLFISFVISLVGISSVIKPIKIIGKWIIIVSVFSGIIILILPKTLNLLFPDPQKNAVQLVLLIFVLGIVIIFSYFVIILTKRQQRSDMKIIFNKINQFIK